MVSLVDLLLPVPVKGEFYVNKICRSTSPDLPASFASRSCASSCLFAVVIALPSLVLSSPAFFYCIWSRAHTSIMLLPVLFGCGTQRRLILWDLYLRPQNYPRAALFVFFDNRSMSTTASTVVVVVCLQPFAASRIIIDSYIPL